MNDQDENIDAGNGTTGDGIHDAWNYVKRAWENVIDEIPEEQLARLNDHSLVHFYNWYMALFHAHDDMMATNANPSGTWNRLLRAYDETIGGKFPWHVFWHRLASRLKRWIRSRRRGKGKHADVIAPGVAVIRYDEPIEDHGTIETW